MTPPNRGVYFYRYLVVDIWSRRIVGWAIHDVESGELAADLVERICADNPRRDTILWLHSDNGAAMKSAPLLAKLEVLAARRRHPQRWSGRARNWEPIRVVCLNPEYDNGSSRSKAKYA